MASFDGGEQRRSATVFVCEVGIGARSEQRPDDCTIPPCDAVPQRRIPKTIDRVEARAGLDERECNVRVIVARRGEEWPVAFGGRDGQVG